MEFGKPKQALRDLWNRQNNDDAVTLADGTKMLVPQAAPIFRPDPPINDPDLERDANRFFSIAPELKGRISRIMYGPGEPADSELYRSKMSPYQFGNSTLLGVTSFPNNEININPSLGSPEFLWRHNNTSTYGDHPPAAILGHELTHAAGYPSEVEPMLAEKIIQKNLSLFGKK